MRWESEREFPGKLGIGPTFPVAQVPPSFRWLTRPALNCGSERLTVPACTGSEPRRVTTALESPLNFAIRQPGRLDGGGQPTGMALTGSAREAVSAFPVRHS